MKLSEKTDAQLMGSLDKGLASVCMSTMRNEEASGDLKDYLSKVCDELKNRKLTAHDLKLNIILN